MSYLTDTRWSSVAMSTLVGAANSLAWMFRMVTLGGILYLVTVEAGADSAQQLDIIIAAMNAALLLFVASAATHGLKEIVDQHDLGQATEHAR